MIKEEKNIDFITTGRQPSPEEFASISEWIKKDRSKKSFQKSNTLKKRNTLAKKRITVNREETTQHR